MNYFLNLLLQQVHSKKEKVTNKKSTTPTLDMFSRDINKVYGKPDPVIEGL